MSCSSRSPARCRSGRRSARRATSNDPSAEAVRPLGARGRDALRRPREPVVDLERAEPPGLPRPAVQERQAAHAEALPQALRRGRAGDPRRRRAARATRCCSARPRRSATRTSSRRSRFLRGALCLNSDYKAKGLQEAADRRLRAPRLHAQGRPDVRLRGPRRGQHRLARPARPRRSTRPRAPGAIDKSRGIYLTEFGIQSKPGPDRRRVAARARPSTSRSSERMAYANPRVKAFSQYLMRDDKPRKGSRGRALLRLRDAGCGRRRARRSPPTTAFMLPLAVDAVRLERRALGPRAAGDRADAGRRSSTRSASGWKRLTALHDRRRLRLPHRRTAPSSATARSWTRPDGATITGPPIRPYSRVIRTAFCGADSADET